MVSNKVIFIAGGTGSWGQELVKQLLERNVGKIIIYSRGELAQVNMMAKFNDGRIKYVIGDVRDYQQVLKHTKGVDIIFNLAALKHVPICENHPQEAIKTNINGTTNLINASIENKVRKFIMVSTDKAVAPTNLYGMTKAVCEKLTIQANALTKDTDFVCVRGGNVLGSNGSVVPFFIKKIKETNIVPVTDKRMTRFFLTLEDAIQLLFQAVTNSNGGEIFVMNMPSFRIIDLADILMETYGDIHTQCTVTGIKEGEKIDEILISEHETRNAFVLNDDYYVIYPEISTQRVYNHGNMIKVGFKTFSTQNKIEEREVLRQMLEKGGFLCQK
jgi:UDP-N-acetylglucosamine 4,6-dehydratase/5-epimerase